MSRLLEQLSAAIHTRRYSARTERAYRRWVVRYVRFCGMRHPRECGVGEVKAFVEHLALQRRLGPSSQNQLIAALVFLYRDVLGQPLGALPAVVRPKVAHRMPNVLEAPDVDLVLAQMSGTPQLVTAMLYGSGLRLSEALSLRVKDLDLVRCTLMVRGGKGNKDRRTVLPERLVPAIAAQIDRVRRAHQKAVLLGGGRYPLPDALARRMPGAVRDWRWAWLFPARHDVWNRDLRTRVRYPVHMTTIQRAIALAGVKSGINRRVTAHTFRHSFATHLLRSGLRYSDGAGAAGPCGRVDDDDLPARSGERDGGSEPVRSVAGRTLVSVRLGRSSSYQHFAALHKPLAVRCGSA